jgi:hypothetical protein
MGMAVGVSALLSGCANTGNQAAVSEPVVVTSDESDLEEEWGIEVVALRLTGADYMLDFRYKVLDDEKAAELFERANKPLLIHKATGAKLEVPRPAKTGPLRPTNPPEAGRTYFILFSNPGVVHAGDEVTVQIGDFEADVVVE